MQFLNAFSQQCEFPRMECGTASSDHLLAPKFPDQHLLIVKVAYQSRIEVVAFDMSVAGLHDDHFE
jgi:hypothetical protein